MRTSVQYQNIEASEELIEDQYERPSFRPVNGTKELQELLGPGTKQLLRLLNSL